MADSLTNFGRFQATLEKHYTELFKTPDYALASFRHTPGSMALTMTRGMQQGTANKDGEGIKRTCKELGIKYTYSAIEAYLKG